MAEKKRNLITSNALIICVLITQMLPNSKADRLIPDNSVIWTGRDDNLYFIDHNDTVTWLYGPPTSGLNFRQVNLAISNSLVGMSYQYSSNLIIVSDSGHNWLTVVDLDTRRALPLHIGTSPGVGQLTIDWRARNVYWTDANYGWIAMKSFPNNTATVNSFDRSFRVVVDTFLDKPTGIVAHPLEHYLFWADAGVRPKIERSNLVGGDRKVLVWQGLITPTCLSIDNNTMRLFWSDPDRQTIEYIYFNGTGRTVFVSESGYDYYGIAVFQDRLIYTAPRRSETGVYSLYNAATGTKLNIVDRPFYYVDVFDKETQPRSALEPCDSTEFDCNQICVHLEHDRGATCFCEDGYDLVNGNQCQADTAVLERHVLFTVNNDVCATSINFIYSLTAFKPPTDCDVVKHDSPITRFALDMNDKYVFYTDGNKIYKQMAFNSTKILLYTAVESIKDLDYDWKTRELFWCQESNTSILYKSVDNPTVDPVLSPPSPSPITSLAVDPHNNHVYWIAEAGADFKLYTWNREDNSVLEIFTSALSNPTDIEYDRLNDRLVWNDDKFFGIIKPDGTGGRKVDTFPDSGLRHGIAVYKNLVLCTIKDGISHFDAILDGSTNLTVTIARDVDLSETILDVHVYDSTTQLDDLDPCEVNNNGCDHLCLPGDVPVCACNLGYELADDNKTCTSNKLAADFTLVLDGLNGFVYQFQKNVSSLSLRIINMTGTNHPVAMAFDQSRDTLTWVDSQSKTIRRVNILQGRETTLTGSDFLETSVLVVDERNGNTFVTKNRTIYIIDNVNSRIVIDSNIIQWTIKSIALSVDKGKLAWIELGNEAVIRKSNMDGSNDQTVVPFDTDRIAVPEVIHFDPDNGDYIYWCDSMKDKIERIDGNLQYTTLYESQFHRPVAFDVDGSRLYYVPSSRRRIYVIDKITGQEVGAVIETPLLGAIYSIFTSKVISFPTTTTTTTTVPVTSTTPSSTTAGLTAESSDSKVPIVPIAAGAGGGLALIIIVVIILVCLNKRRNEKMAMRRPSNLPHIAEVNRPIEMNSRRHDYDGMGGPSPDPPPRPLTADEEKDGGVYHDLDETALVVKMPPKDDKPRGSVSDRYSSFPELDYHRSKYITPTYDVNTPKPDYADFDDASANYLDLTESSRDRLGMSDDKFLWGAQNMGFTGGSDGYLTSSSLSGSRPEYSRQMRENRDFSDGSVSFYDRDTHGYSGGSTSRYPENTRDLSNGSAQYVSRYPVPHAHSGGWHGSRSGNSGESRSGNSSGSRSGASRGYTGFIERK